MTSQNWQYVIATIALLPILVQAILGFFPQEMEKPLTRQFPFLLRWYLRFPLAFLMLYAAVFFVLEKHFFAIPILLVIDAALLAREISWLLLIGGGLYLIFAGIAVLPVSVAIIIGAIIIASSIKK